ncbi:AAA family ATPase [Thiofilum flexile]|uniref:AAA family ATPase n=1 Tax=Thiofilum flexile TaxID=125627 RepID=UPI00037C9771|nr:ATP-binding protein [Thiofilum flexile]
MNQVVNETDIQEPVRVVEIGVKGLFGLYDHTVKLKDERVTIIHGPNGVGKTVFLQAINVFLSRNSANPGLFKEVFVIFNDGQQAAFRGKMLESKDIPNLPYPTYFIDVKRLCDTSDKVHRIKQLVNHLSEKIDKAKVSYSEYSQSLDQSFPIRLIKTTVLEENFQKNTLMKMFSQIDWQRKRYQSIGLLEASDQFSDNEFELANLKPEQYTTMTLYAKDTKAKLDILEPLATKIEKLIAILNHKLKNKKVFLEHKNGLVIRNSNDVELTWDSLSSGEQHLFVLIYELLLKVEPNTLVLIDEPELSLHISWQRELVDDFLGIIKLNSFDIVLATHSPSIINDHSNLMVAFKSNIQQEVA